MTTNNALSDWTRDFHQVCDNRAFLFYVVFGANAGNLRLSRSQYRCDGVPDGLELLAYGPGRHPEVLDSFRDGYLWEALQARQPALAETIAAQTECVVLRGTFADEATLNYFRNTIGLLTCMLDCGGVAIYDPQSFTWWSRSDWKTKVFEPGLPQPGEHVVILVSDEEDGTQWFHTRGMRKFGRPDLSLHSVPAGYREAVVDLFNRFIDLHAYGGVIAEGQEIHMRTLPEGMICVHGGDEDDPDFNNVHVEIMWPSAPGR
ncbi:hypothetical protein UB46_28305 [Burkholderiaceae bacterium 16]|nr:hypothetical protein UB46_28305 [Burkholderiaceae bacterium 16]